MKTEKIKDSYGFEIKMVYKDMNKRKMNSLQKDYVLWLENKHHQSF